MAFLFASLSLQPQQRGNGQVVHPWLMGMDLKGQPLAQAPTLSLGPVSGKLVFTEALLRHCATCSSCDFMC